MCILCLAWKGRNSFSVIEVLLLSHWPVSSSVQLNMDVLGRSIYLSMLATVFLYIVPLSDGLIEISLKYFPSRRLYCIPKACYVLRLLYHWCCLLNVLCVLRKQIDANHATVLHVALTWQQIIIAINIGWMDRKTRRSQLNLQIKRHLLSVDYTESVASAGNSKYPGWGRGGKCANE